MDLSATHADGAFKEKQNVIFLIATFSGEIISTFRRRFFKSIDEIGEKRGEGRANTKNVSTKTSHSSLSFQGKYYKVLSLRESSIKTSLSYLCTHRCASKRIFLGTESLCRFWLHATGKRVLQKCFSVINACK